FLVHSFIDNGTVSEATHDFEIVMSVKSNLFQVTVAKRHGVKQSVSSSSPSSKKKPLDPQELNNMIQNKISQLETESSLEDEEEKAISKAVKKASKEIKEIINSHDDQLEKIDTIQQRYMELFQEMKRLERDYAKMKKRNELLQKEKDSTKNELAKSNSVKHKFENICRELHKENKRIKEESKRLAASEQQKREELSSKFENTIWEIKSKMEEDTDEKKKRAEDNEMLKDKFRSFLEQYELREKHFNSVVRSKDLELQLYEAKLHQQKQLTDQEIVKVNSLKEQVENFTKTEVELRKQLSTYVEKFKQVEETLNKSNELFLSFRKEMEQMNKKTKKLEKENATVKGKCETMNRNILEMAEERTKDQKTIEESKKKQTKLENLCRALQAERTILKKKVQSLEALSPPSSPPPSSPSSLSSPHTSSPSQSSSSSTNYQPNTSEDEVVIVETVETTTETAAASQTNDEIAKHNTEIAVNNDTQNVNEEESTSDVKFGETTENVSTTTDSRDTNTTTNSQVVTSDVDPSTQWETRVSRSRKMPYYYNRVTKESTWELPRGVDPQSIKGYSENSAQQLNTIDPVNGGAGQIKASHLLVKHRESRRPSSWRQSEITRTKEEAFELIKGYYERIKAKEIALGELALTESDCSSAKRNGDLGFFGRGQMQPSFEDAAFKLEVGELSGPVWSDSGVHLIQRTE
ncbi:15789_t:CDS:10, partial [Entrophospora sp. SA101]